MSHLSRTVVVLAFVIVSASASNAFVICAKDDGTGVAKEKSKLVLKTECTAGKEVPIGIAVTGTVGSNATVSIYDADLLVDEGNVQVTSGSGTTDGVINGKGNIIVGYNEATIPKVRTGSHNLVVGSEHSYSAYGGFVSGTFNSVSGAFATVSGGSSNEASGTSASVSGGLSNIASNFGASVSGGFDNTASGPQTSISGGYLNTAVGPISSISGGNTHVTSGDRSSISGGAGLTTSVAAEWHAGQSATYPTGTQY